MLRDVLRGKVNSDSSLSPPSERERKLISDRSFGTHDDVAAKHIATDADAVRSATTPLGAKNEKWQLCIAMCVSVVISQTESDMNPSPIATAPSRHANMCGYRAFVDASLSVVFLASLTFCPATQRKKWRRWPWRVIATLFCQHLLRFCATAGDRPALRTCPPATSHSLSLKSTAALKKFKCKPRSLPLFLTASRPAPSLSYRRAPSL